MNGITIRGLLHLASVTRRVAEASLTHTVARASGLHPAPFYIALKRPPQKPKPAYNSVI